MHAQGLRSSMVVCIVSLILCGCVTTPPIRLYVLNAHWNSRNEGPRTCERDRIITMGMSPIEMPRYLDRPQIMTRVSENELKLSELDLWAEPLKNSITRVMVQNLNALLCSDIDVFPWEGVKHFTYRLSVQVMRLDGTPGGEAVLHVRWTIVDEKAEKPLIMKESRYTDQIGSSDYPALVSSYSRLFASFSREVADSFTSISQGK